MLFGVFYFCIYPSHYSGKFSEMFNFIYVLCCTVFNLHVVAVHVF
uniref:Uncharacterized protein n=1 Tax=Setaria italica TaxID=4555 RepID=K4API2_SETIT